MKDFKILKSNLNRLEKNVVKNIIEAQRQTAIDIALDTRKLAPKNTGRYADSIKVKEQTITKNHIKIDVVSDMKVVSLSGNKYLLGFLLENGTAPHTIYPVNAKFLHFLIDGKDVYAKKVEHPGFVSMPHFIPALNANKSRYKQRIKKAIKEEFK